MVIAKKGSWFQYTKPYPLRRKSNITDSKLFFIYNLGLKHDKYSSFAFSTLENKFVEKYVIETTNFLWPKMYES